MFCTLIEPLTSLHLTHSIRIRFPENTESNLTIVSTNLAFCYLVDSIILTSWLDGSFGQDYSHPSVRNRLKYLEVTEARSVWHLNRCLLAGVISEDKWSVHLPLSEIFLAFSENFLSEISLIFREVFSKRFWATESDNPRMCEHINGGVTGRSIHYEWPTNQILRFYKEEMIRCNEIVEWSVEKGQRLTGSY